VIETSFAMPFREFSATVEAAMEAEGWLAAACEQLRLPSQTAFAIGLCVEELFLNAVQHGRASAVTVALSPAPDDGVCIEFADDGAPFNPIVAPARRIERRCDDFEIGGYGTGLLRRFARGMSYRREGGRNLVALEFDATRAGGALPAT
jgi:anti-sigma regulatory factor (Ser/Thr protein kinase)